MKVAIDGPAGAGKSSVAKEISQRRGFLFLDTGATYRCIALAALQAGVVLEDEAALCDLARRSAIKFCDGADRRQHVFLDGADVTDAIRTPQVDAAVSRVAKVPGVRSLMVGLQRTIAEGVDVVAEGRDIGTNVFPDAQGKVFLTADPAARALRRAEQNARRAGDAVRRPAVEEILDALNERDKADSSRSVCPLTPAADAVHIDSSHMTLAEVVAAVERLIDQARTA